MDRSAPSEWEQTLGRLVAHVRSATGLDLEASLQWVSAAEQREADAEFERMVNDPDVHVVRLGSVDSDTVVRPWRSYQGFWALELPGQVTMIQDPAELAGVIEDYVIEAVWHTTGIAPRPGFLQGT